jgi:hypothetical protein
MRAKNSSIIKSRNVCYFAVVMQSSWAYGKEKIRGAERNLPDFFGLCPTSPEKFFVKQINFGDPRLVTHARDI